MTNEKKKSLSVCPGSFRDPSGRVFFGDGKIWRSIMPCYAPHWEVVAPFLEALASREDVPSFCERKPLEGSWKTLEVMRLPFLSYPYEWSFGQLKDAALLTLRLQKEALSRDLTLKDASAYNIQFVGVRPLFIDLLSFEKRTSDQPWSAYRQFCMHFLAPLALMARTDLRSSFLTKCWVEGLPLDLTARLLSWKTYFSFPLLWHIHLHARMLAKCGDGRSVAQKARAAHVSKEALERLTENLMTAVSSLTCPQIPTSWGDYYQDTNYSDAATQEKMRHVSSVAEKLKGNCAVDLGANTGRYSRLLSPHFSFVLAPDGDALAVEHHYRDLKKATEKNIFPLVLDLANPSPSLGWACCERLSFKERCTADLLLALALIHHLVITAGIPFEEIAAHFVELLTPQGHVLVEFIPKEDSQIQRMLAAREDIFTDYTQAHFEDVFSRFFSLEEKFLIQDSDRTLYLWKRRA
ncbi:MAG: hypothetical protein LBF76_02155 [Holosporales bacterium]|jgi:SAM-dependent methyltransferase|nr:hypothetical protein [Holosporales bacterium]